MTLSTADATIIRSVKHTYSGPRFLTVNAAPLDIGASAQINKTTAFTYPLLSAIPVDNTSADWLTEGLRGRLVLIGTAPGLFDVATATLTADVTSNSITINSRHAGISDWARDIAQLLANDLYVSIVKYRHPTGHMSSIRKGKFYKFDTDAFSPSADRFPHDLINLGRHQQAYVNPTTGLARFTIDVSRFHWTGNSYSSHTWGLDGQTQVSASSTQLVVDCEPGCHEITYTLTNNRGKVTTAYRYLFANDDTDFPPLNVQYSLGEIDCQQDRQGATYSLSFLEAIDNTILFPGQLFLMTEHPQWGSSTPADLDDPQGVVTHHVGYVTEAQTRTARGERSTLVTLESPVKLARQVPIEKQVIIEKKTPANWAEVTKKLSNPVGMFYYLAMLHAPYLINGHDFDFGEGLGNSTSAYLLGLRRKIINLDQDVTLGGQLEQLSRLLDGEGNIGSRCDGTTVMVRCPLYFANSSRNALSTQWTYSAGDVESELERPLRFRAQVGKTFAGAFAFDGSSQSQAFRSMAPGYVRSQAGGEVTMDDTTVTSAAGQTRVNELSGFHHARLNKRSDAFGFAVNGNMDVAEPCDMHHWWALTLGASYDPFGEGWSSARMLMERVTRRWSGPGTRRKEITVEVEPESFGYPGIRIPINPGAGNTWVQKPAPTHFEPFQTRPPDLGLDLDVMVAWNAWGVGGRAGRSFNFATPHTSWGFLDDEVLSVCLDWHSDYFTSSGDLGCYVLTYDDNDVLHLLYITDLLDTTGTPSELETWAFANVTGEFYYQAHVICSKEEVDFILIAYKNSSGVYVDRSTDAGATWEGEFRVGAEIDDTGWATFALGVAVFDERQVICAPDGTTNIDGDYIHFVYTASTKAGAFSKITNPTGFQVVSTTLALSSATNVIVGLYKPEAPEPDNPLDVVDFDSGYPDYSLSNAVTSTGVGTFLGFGGQANMGYGFTASGFGTIALLTTTISLTAFYNLTSVTFLRAFSNTAISPVNRRWYYTVSALDAQGHILGQYSTADEPSTDFTNPDTITVTAEQMGLTAADWVWQVVIQLTDDWDSDGGSSGNYVMIDDIDIDAFLVSFDTDRSLYTLDPSTSTYTRRESDQLVPFHHYGIGADGGNVRAITRDEDGSSVWLLRSSNSGQTWTKLRRVDGYIGLKFNAGVSIGVTFYDVVIAFGYNRLGVSLDGGDTGYDMLGDWAAKLGFVGPIEGVAGVLI